MYILLSPAKTFNKTYLEGSRPLYFINETNYLLKHLQTKSLDEIKTIFKTSDNLSLEILNYYKDFNSRKKAISLYGGIVYQSLEFNYLNYDNIYIFSALYGLLNANTSISEYRLDFTNKILDQSLYNYWGKKIDSFIKTNLNDKIIINLASNEFSKLIDLTNPNVYTIEFLVLKNGKVTKPSYLIKQMRGLFAKDIINKNINAIDELSKIELDGFKFKSISKQKLTFIKE